MNSKNISSDNSVKASNPTIYEWTAEEKQLFENALAELDPSSPNFYENVAYRIPWKSIHEIKDHYHQLIGDIKKIDSNVHQMPTHETSQEKHQEAMGFERETKKHQEASQDEIETKGVSPSPEIENVECKKQRRRAIPWTAEEHQLFLIGLNIYGKGNWKNISKNCVLTKTPAQVASHAQKFFARLGDTERRRPSIHDTASYFISSPQYDFPKVQNEFSYNGGILENSNLIFTPQNSFPNNKKGPLFSHPHHHHSFTQNHNLNYNGDFIDSSLIPPPQNGFPNIGNEIAAFAHPYTHQGGVQNLNSNHNDQFSSLTQSIDSNLIFPPQNGFPNIDKETSFSQPQPYRGFPQNLNSNYNDNFVDSSLISPPQNSLPCAGNGTAFAHHHPHQGGVQNLYSNQNDEFPSLPNSINSYSTFPPQNVIPKIGEEISFSQPQLHGSIQSSNSNYNNELFNFANCYDSTFLPSSSSSGSTSGYQPYDP